MFLAAVLLVGLGLLGYYLASARSSSAAGGTDAYIISRRLVMQTVTLKRNGKTMVRRVPVVRTVTTPAKPVTVEALRTVTSAGGVQRVPVTRIRYVPVDKVGTVVRMATLDRVVTRVETRNGKSVTVRSTVPVTVQETVTNSQTVTDQQTVTSQRTTTVARTATLVTTQPVTVTLPTTVLQTSTVRVTTTLPITVTVTSPSTTTK